MSEQETQESSKTVVAFAVGLIIGGLLVWVFSGSPDEQPTEIIIDDGSSVEDAGADNDNQDTTDRDDADSDSSDMDTTPELPTGEGSVTVNNQPAGASVTLTSATFPTDEGWVGVREYNSGELGFLLGAVRYSKEQGLVPEEVVLLRSTTPGREYAVVFYTESGDRVFNLADDVQIPGVLETFTAQ